MGKSLRLEPVRLAVAPLLRCQTDERLLELARAGHERAFEAIVERYRRPLLQYCGRLLPPSRAEDVVQQAFLGAYRAIRSGEGGLQLRPWLYRAAHNAAVDALRQNGWDNEPIDESSNGCERADEAWECREDLRDLVASLSALPSRQRSAIVLRELEGCGHEEIATKLGMSEGAARQLIHRARAALRAGASALAPSGLLEQLLTVLRADPVPARISELVAGGGTACTLAKVGAAGAVAIAIGGAHAPVPSGDRVKHRLAAPETAAASHARASTGAIPVRESLVVGLAPSPVSRPEPTRDPHAGERRSGDEGGADRAERGHRNDDSSSRDEPDGERSEPLIGVVDPEDGDESAGYGSGHRPGAREPDDEESEPGIDEHDRKEHHGGKHGRAERDDEDESDLAEWDDDEHESEDAEDDED